MGIKAVSFVATTLVLSTSVKAAVFNSYDNPLDEGTYTLTLDTGSTPWQNQTENVYSTYNSSSSSWTDVRYEYNQAPVIVDPKPGVDGSISYYREEITEYWSGGSQDQSARINFSAKLKSDLTNVDPDPLNPVAPQSTPSSYILQGSITQNTSLYGSTYDDLYFSMGLSNIFDESYTGNAEGALSFFVSNTPGDWAFTFRMDFDARSNNIELSNSLNLDLGDTVYFMAQYEIFGTEGDLFDINALSLGVSASQHDSGSGIYDETSEIKLYHSSVIPALAPVPVPAAVWLFTSGLLGLIGIARRKIA
jgi:hypothetical protein